MWLCASALLLAGCAGGPTPENLSAALYSPEKSAPADERAHRHSKSLSFTHNVCPPAGTATFIMPATGGHRHRRRMRQPLMRYSPGDRFNILILDSPEFSGDYAINLDGMVVLPYAGQIAAVGLTNAELTAKIQRKLESSGVFRQNAGRITVRPVQYAPINVTVSGAVFFPGRHAINTIKDSDKLAKVLAKFGDSPQNRFVPAALQAAGGVRPDADLSNVVVTRKGRRYRLNWRGAITGQPVDDLPLIDGDHVEVGEAGCFQSALVRPSQITVAGIRIFSSNLTLPALNNANSVRSQNLSGGVPYGTRLLQGLVQANCVGGSVLTNARRHAVLISRNPKTRETEVIQRPIEELVRSADRDSINPYLMPDDAIACYDSAVSEVRDVMSVFQGILGPITTLKGY